MIETLASALLGGGAGILGTVVGKVFGWLETREKRANMKLEHEHEARLLELQMQGRREESESEARLAEINTSAAMRTASYAHDSSSGETYRWVAATLRLVRPVLTCALIVTTACIVFFLEDVAAVVDVANQVVFLTTMAVSWWFGDRAPSKK
jgi:hypothetical protein